MKCDFCTWDTRPDNIQPLKGHVKADHPELEHEEFFVVWRDGGLLVARAKKKNDIVIHVDFDWPDLTVEVLAVEPVIDPVLVEVVDETVS